MNLRCPSCGAPVRVVHGGGGTHWYEPRDGVMLPLLRTPDGVPEGWCVTVDDSVPVLRRRERKVYTDEAGVVRYAEDESPARETGS